MKTRSWGKSLLFSISLLILGSPGAVWAQDVCGGNAAIDGNLGSALGPAVASGSTIGKGDDFFGNCGGELSEDLAYTWTAPIDATYVFDTLGSNYDALFYVVPAAMPQIPNYDCQGSGIICHYPGAFFGPRVPIHFEAGSEWVIVVDGSLGSAGDFVLNIEASERPTQPFPDLCIDGLDNDGDGDVDLADRDCICGGDAVIDADLGTAVGPVVATGSTVGAGNDYSGNCGGDNAPDRSFLWTAPIDATYVFDTLGSDYGALFYVVPVNVPSIPDWDCQNTGTICHYPNAPFGPRMPLHLTAGSKWLIVVDGQGTDAGNFVLNIAQTERPTEVFPDLCTDGLDNDQDGLTDLDDRDCICGGDAVIDADLGSAVGPAVATGTTVGKGNDYSGNCGGDNAEDVTYLWTAPEDGTFNFDTLGSNDEALFYVVPVNIPSIPSWDCQNTGTICHYPNAPFGPRMPLRASAGDKWIVVVDGQGTAAGNYVLNIEKVTEETGLCGDAQDNDGDNLTDCEDSDCQGNDCDLPFSCTEGGVCENGACEGAQPMVCESVDPCQTAGVCARGECEFEPLPDGTACEDGNSCTSGDSCQNGHCTSGPASSCEDGNPCTVDSCGSSGCEHAPLDCSGSDDGNVCNGQAPVCNPSNGQCENSVGPLVCADGNACNGIETCNPTLGCQSGEPISCDDGDPCTADSCDSLNGCGHEALPDSDGDGSCDAVDECPADQNNDGDGDGVCGNVDNCPEANNPDQADEDNDGIGDACDEAEPDPCACCVEDEIVAKTSYRPPRWEVGEYEGCREVKLPLPAEIPVIEGNAGNQWASLTFRHNNRGVACLYKGGASQLHPTKPADIAKGLKYKFQSCTNGMRPGQTIQTGKIELIVLTGDILSPDKKNPRTVVRLPLTENPATGCEVCE